MRTLLQILFLLFTRQTTVYAISPISFSPKTKPTSLNPSLKTANVETTPQVPNVLSLLGILAQDRPTAAKVATILLLVNGVLFRFGGEFLLKHCLDVKTVTHIDRMLTHRVGRRFLALGAGAFHLFFLGGAPLSAIGTCGAVLLLDRTKRTNLRQHYRSNHGPGPVDPFMDVIRLHLYSVLAWSGILHPILPCAPVATKIVGIILGFMASRDIFFPDNMERTNNDILLYQSSGYALAGLSVFVLSLSSATTATSLTTTAAAAVLGGHLNALGFACIANLYSLITLSPTVGGGAAADAADKEQTIKPPPLTRVGRVKRFLFSAWLWINGAVTAAVASPGASPS